MKAAPALFLAWLVSAAPAAAQPPAQYHFAQPEAPLDQSLAAFSRSTGLAVVYTTAVPAGQRAPALQGLLPADAALARLLAGSGLQYQWLDGRSVLLTPVVSPGELALAASHIDGNSLEAGRAAYQPATVTSVARSSTPRASLAQTINSVPPALLADQVPRNLDDALAYVPGISQGNTLGSTQDALLKRGFGDNRDGSIMQDGMPLVQGRGLNVTAERIEVLKGPASLLYGVQDAGGVVNVVAKKPLLQAASSLTLRGSSYAGSKNGSGATLDTSGPLGTTGLAYRLVADQEDEDYWRNFGVHREQLVAPSLAWYGDTTQVIASFQHREFLTPFDRGTAIDPSTNRPLAIPATHRLDEPFNDMQGRSDLYQLQVEQALNDTWQAHMGFSYNRETYDASQVRITGVSPSTGTLTRSMDGTRGALTYDRFSTLSLEGNPTWLGMRHELLFGIDDENRKIYRRDLIRQASLSTFSYTRPNYGQEVEGTTVSAADSNQLDELRSDSLFLQDAIHLNEQWLVVAGGRYQVYDQYAGKGRPFHANTDTNGQTWLPRAGLVYAPAVHWSFYGSYSESFRPNSSIATLSGSVVLDSSFAPERGRAWELGARYDVPGAISANLAVFDIRKRNVLVSQSVDSSTVYSLAGAVRSRGIELDLSGQLSERWGVLGSYALTDAWVSRDPQNQGKPLQNTPRHSASLFAVYNAGNLACLRNLRLGGGARYVGERAGDASDTFQLPGYTVADAFASVDTRVEGYPVTLKLNVKNLFDRVYYSSAASRYFVSVGDARQFSLSATVHF